MPRKRKPTRIILDTTDMKQIALAGICGKSGTWQLLFNKMIRENHTLIISNQLGQQYLTKIKEEGIPAEYFLSFLQTTLEATHQLKRVSNARANRMQVRVKLPKEDVFLAQIAIASNPNHFDVCIVSSERGIYTMDRRLQREHSIRALTPSDFIDQYC